MLGFSGQGFDRGAAYRRTPESYETPYASMFEGVSGDVFGAGQSLTLNFGAAGVEVELGRPGTGDAGARRGLGLIGGVQQFLSKSHRRNVVKHAMERGTYQSGGTLRHRPFRVSTWRPGFQRWLDRMDCDFVG